MLSLDEVLLARVGDVVETLKSSGRQHALVVEHNSASSRQMVRGIFSASQISRQLGIPADGVELLQTFAALDQALGAMEEQSA